MTTTKHIQKIVDDMNQHPEKLFGGKYDHFFLMGFVDKKGEYHMSKMIVGEQYKDHKDDTGYTFHDTRLLRELAKAKWGDATDEYVCIGIAGDIIGHTIAWIPTSQFGNALDRKGISIHRRLIREVKYEKWVLIEDEAKLIETIANDILS